MKRSTQTLFVSGALALTAAFAFINASVAATTASKVTYNGKIYYKVTSTDTSMDTGDEVCASVGQKCVGFAQASNAVCKLFHPDAKTLMSVNGSKYDFYCNGTPQQDIACAKTMNTCQTCAACNPNNTCSSPIGQHFREMFVECTGASSSGKAGSTGVLPLPKTSSSKPNLLTDPKNCGAVARVCPTGTACTNGACLKPNLLTDNNNCGALARVCPTGTSCKNGACMKPVSSSSKPNLLTDPKNCGVMGHVCLTGTICKNGACVKASSSSSSKPNLLTDPKNCGAIARVCPTGMACMNGACLKPNLLTDNNNCGAVARVCPTGTSCKNGACLNSASSSAKKIAGQVCVHGGDCQSGMCLGVVPGKLYECSCIDPVTAWSGCKK